ncbi:unannotated protein [freshwater metagenome]|uniref:Unannotated protein n=1 Tax=freshwater metagenome TaxID=449393 RepID=A0A6J6C367_9ZZZZ
MNWDLTLPERVIGASFPALAPAVTQSLAAKMMSGPDFSVALSKAVLRVSKLENVTTLVV